MSAASDQRQLVAGARGGSDGDEERDPYEDVRAHTKRLRAGASARCAEGVVFGRAFFPRRTLRGRRRRGAGGIATRSAPPAGCPLPRGLTRCDAPTAPRVP
jgi:hypothetical protein